MEIRTPIRYEIVKHRHRKPMLRLLGVDPDSPPFPDSTLTEQEAVLIQEWVEYNAPSGRRMSFDMWQFDDPEDQTAFILRWC
jgi:hypothetical protein